MSKEIKKVPEKKTPETTSITVKKLGYICVGLFVLLLILKNAFGSGSGEKQDATTPNAEITQTKEVGTLREYNIVERSLSEDVVGENLDDAFQESLKENPARNKELVLRVVVPPDVNEEDLKVTITHITDNETSKDNDLDEITIFVYDREEDVDWIYTVAKATWAPGGELGNVTKEIAKSNDRSSYEIKWDIATKENQESSKKANSVATSQETEEDLSISKDRFNYYNEVYLKFSELQKEYEQEYAKFGEVGFEEAKAIPKEADFPEYGSIKSEISSIYQSLPTSNDDMSSGERHLTFKFAAYGAFLIFMSPKEHAIEGIDSVLESRKGLEAALEEVRTFNGF